MKTYGKLTAILAALFFIPLLSWAHDMKTGQVYGACETKNPTSPIKSAGVQIISASEEEWNGQLILFDRNGKAVYKTSQEEDWSKLSGGVAGRSWPSAICDIDKDGFFEIIITEAKSDVSPQEFRVLKWKDGKLLFYKKGYLTETKQNFFEWTNEPYDEKAWVTEINEDGQGGVTGAIMKLADGGASVQNYNAHLTKSGSGFKAKKI